MTGEGQVQPGESRAVSWKQGPPGRTLEHGGIWKEKPLWVEKGPLVTGHVREVGGDLGNDHRGGAAAEGVSTLKEAQNYISLL